MSPLAVTAGEATVGDCERFGDSVPSGSKSFASPKSRSFTVPSAPSRTLPGFKSR